jgi:uncharacterized membrane protein (DUF2068 family)
VAVFEAFKGILVLLAGFGLLSLIHRDAQQVAEELVARLHLNPARHLPRVFIDLSGHLTDAKLWGLALLAGAYAALRLAEAYGLWWEQAWAEWLAVVSGGLYIPLEVHHLAPGITWLRVGTLTVNLLIVAYMGYALWRLRQREPKEE